VNNMLCYKDRTYCGAECKLQGTCKDSYVYAKEEQKKHPDAFVRKLPFSIRLENSSCEEKIPIDN
jgi:hypothetical protein